MTVSECVSLSPIGGAKAGSASSKFATVFFTASAGCCWRAAEPAEVEKGPERLLKVAEGRVAVLTCRVFGAPRPTIIWQKGDLMEDVEDFHDARINVLDSGDLEIQVRTRGSRPSTVGF